jgi:hypothetical protein
MDYVAALLFWCGVSLVLIWWELSAIRRVMERIWVEE